VVDSRDTPDEWWEFRLVLVYPHLDIRLEPGVKLCYVACGGQVVVEMVEGMSGLR